VRPDPSCNHEQSLQIEIWGLTQQRNVAGERRLAKDTKVRLVLGRALWPKGISRPQRILRRSDPRLTANIYSRVHLADLQAGIDRFAIPDRAPAR
jgi:hypothetical protein